MTIPSDQKTAAGSPAGPGAAPSYEEKFHGFWKKNRSTIFAGCVAVLLVVTGKGAWEIFNAQREKSTAADYAAAITPEALRAFARAHQGHRLAGVASLRLADDEYSAGKYPDALEDYELAAEALRGTPLGGRAQLGQAVCKIQAGRTEDGEAQLKQLAADLAQLQAVRAEAAYHLASVAADGGRVEDAKKFADQVQQIDPAGIWAQRAITLRANLPPDAEPSQTGSAPNVLFSTPGK
jgi:hypothetical protein